MDAVVLWKLQTVGEGADALDDGERQEVLVGELASGMAGDRDLNVRLKLEENLLTDGEDALRVVIVGQFLEAILGAHRPGA